MRRTFFLSGGHLAKPNLWNRAKLATKILRWPGGEQKKAPFQFPSWTLGNPQWTTWNFESYAANAFGGNSLVYAAIMYKVRALSAAPLRAYEGDQENPEPLKADHPLAKLIERPNRHQSWWEFQGQATAYLNISGNNFAYLDRPNRKALPTAIYNLRPDRMRIVPGREGGEHTIVGYIYKPEWGKEEGSLPILPRDMMHVKLPNPGDDYEGMGSGLSPIKPSALSIDVDNEVTGFLKLFFERGMMPPIAISYDGAMDDAEMARALERFEEIYSGVTNMVRPMLLDNRGKVEKLGYTFQELGFEGIDSRNESRIIMPFGVPPILLGSRYGMERSTFSNYEESRRAFWQDTMIPELRMFEAEYRHYLQSEGDEGWVAFDLSKVPALQEDKLAQVTAAKTLFDMGYGANQATTAVGLDLDDLSWGDVGYLPMGIMPVGSAHEEQAPVVAGVEEEKRFHFTAEAKVTLWKATDQIAHSWEPKYLGTARELFKSDEKNILAILAEGKKRSVERKATYPWDEVILEIERYLRTTGTEKWREKFTPLLAGTSVEQGGHWAKILGQQFEPTDVTASDWFRSYTLEFVDPITDTSRNQISDLLSVAQEEGWSVNKSQEGLQDMFRQWIDGDVSPEDWLFANVRLPNYRAEAIARTESIRASNASTNELFNKWNVPAREWVATPDGRGRESHMMMDGQVQPTGTPFESPLTGAKLMYPGDPAALPEETVNCRCAIVAVTR